MFSSLCFCPQRYFLLLMFWLLGKGGLGICCAHMLNSYSTQKASTHRCVLGHFICRGDGKAQSITRCIKHAHTRSLSPLHNADFSFWPTHAAQQQQNRALCSFLTRLLVLLSDASPTHTSLHHFRYTSSPSKSLSFLLLITVVGSFELFKAARKDPQCSQKRWSVCGGGGGKEGEGRGRQIRFCWHGRSVHGPEALVKLLFLSHTVFNTLTHTGS